MRVSTKCESSVFIWFHVRLQVGRDWQVIRPGCPSLSVVLSACELSQHPILLQGQLQSWFPNRSLEQQRRHTGVDWRTRLRAGGVGQALDVVTIACMSWVPGQPQGLEGEEG
jgi:hypothetical protein